MEDLSKHPNLLRRNGRYYFRMRVPLDVAATIGKKEIKKSLKTSDLREAKMQLRLEQLKAEDLFRKARQRTLPPKTTSPLLSLIDIERAIRIWHQDETTKQARQDDSYRVTCSEDERQRTIDTLRGDLAALDSNNEALYSRSVQSTLKGLIPELSSKKQPDLFWKAHNLVLQSLIEQTYSQLERYGDHYRRIPFSFFQTSRVAPTEHQVSNEQISLLNLIAKFKKAKLSEGLTNKTINGYKLMFDFTTELFGGDKLISSISPEDCRKFKTELLKLPSNAKKLYPSLSLLESIKAHSECDTGTLSGTSVNGHIVKLSTLMTFAVKEGYINKNPCESLKKVKVLKSANKGRKPFSEGELIKLIKAPIYSGCIDDEWNYKSKGDNRPRRHKFWIPLIALYSGMRLNEICQLLTSDIEKVSNTPVIQVRLEGSDEKQLKNPNSERTIPIHNQLIKIGFLNYVEEIQRQGHKRLFPDITRSTKGSYSDNFSKWFRRFLNSVKITTQGTCFHSFRHTFRDAMRESDIPREAQAFLGGWRNSTDSMDGYGEGYKIETLDKYIQSVTYGKIDILLTETQSTV